MNAGYTAKTNLSVVNQTAAISSISLYSTNSEDPQHISHSMCRNSNLLR